MENNNTERRITGGIAAVAGVAAVVGGIAGWQALRRATADRELLPRGRAFITGASSGIGEAFARRLAAEGFDLTLIARREERLRALAAELMAASSIRVDVLAADLSRDEDIARIARAIESQNDVVLLINNAGFGTRGSFTDVPLERHLDMIRVHDMASVALTCPVSRRESISSAWVMTVAATPRATAATAAATVSQNEPTTTAPPTRAAARIRKAVAATRRRLR